jgi:hypothetical protein
MPTTNKAEKANAAAPEKTAQTFTPGPWVIEPYAWHYLITTADFDEGHPERLGEIVANTRDSQNSKANAELIAAAPDLFRQLTALATQLESAGLIVPPGVRAALAKVKGGQS